MTKTLALLLCLITTYSVQSQLLFPESFVVIFDSTKTFKGSVSPSIEVKTQRQLYLEITNRADVALKFKNHAITLANKFELTRDGSETIISGGFLYGKYKTFFDNPLVLEHYAQYQWAEARGLVRKTAIGSNIRYRIIKNEKGGIFAGIGPFFEYENWTFRGVPESRLPVDVQPVSVDIWKLNMYVSTKRELSDKIKFEGALYYHDDFESFFDNPRWAGNVGLSYFFTEHIALGAQFRFIYDYAPIVPVDKLWINTFSALEITF